MRMRLRAVLCVCALAGWVGAGELDDALAKTKAYKEGESRAALAAAQTLIRDLAKTPANRAAIEKSLLALLTSDATKDAKAFACSELSIFGSPASVPALAKLLGDDALSFYARTALARMPGPESAAILRAALGTVKGKALLGVIDSVGERGDAQAVPVLQKLLTGDTAAAATAALGKIGTLEAAQALAKARPVAPPALQSTLDDAWLLCADSLVRQKNVAAAAPIYKNVYDSAKIEPLRVAAFRGLLATGEKTALAVILKNLASDDARMRSVAAGFARDMAGTPATQAFAAALPGLPADAQALLLAALAARGDAAALPAVIAATKSKDGAVRIAALEALGALGDSATVPFLAAAAAAKGPEQSAARNSLVQLRDKGTDAALLSALGKGETPVRVECVRALAERGAQAAESKMLALVGSDDATLRYEAIKALAILATPKALPSLIASLSKTESSKERRGLEKSIAKLLTRMDDHETAAPQFMAAIPKASAKAKPVLVRLLGRVDSRTSLDAIRKLTGDADAAVADAAVRALVEWPDATPIADALAIAQNGKTPVHKILAIRGAIRMAGLPSDRKPEQTVDLLATALKAAERPDEKKQVIAALSAVHHIRS
ncbi:HEAT repeat domain-containing protein, partial [bacterium]|nr:HEAT repeat domain-containing protein [bacterium]